LGILWEHLVLNEIQAQLQTRRVHYWRNKGGNEVDFVLAGRGQKPIAIECKWSASNFDPAGMQAFRRRTLRTLPIKVIARTDSSFLLVKQPTEPEPEMFEETFACE
jgi:predicted AAA+ superfamily ATPase